MIVRLLAAVGCLATPVGGVVAAPPAFSDVTRPTLAGVLVGPGVAAELKLTPAQQKALTVELTAAEAKYTAGVNAVTTTDPLAARAQYQHLAAAAANAAMTAVVKGIDAGQLARLKQIDRQARGTAALLDPDVQAALKLTAEQKHKLDALTDDYTNRLNRLKRAASGAQAQATIPGTDLPLAGQSVFTGATPVSLRREYLLALKNVLSVPQVDAWYALLGEPFKPGR